MATVLWLAHPECPEHAKAELELRVRSLPSSFLVAPVDGEVFENAALCQERLQGWALSQGFAIVRKSGSMKQARPRFDFRCIHHGNDTLNTRQLEKHVERDEENRIASQRQQEATSINARSCLYLIYLAFKQIGKRGSGEYSLILGISDDTLNHLMAANPLRYRKEHIKTLLSFQPAFELGKSLRMANLSYSVALRVLE